MDERNQRILSLLSHSARVQLISMLGKKAMRTNEMADGMPIELAGTIVHLNYLINEGLIYSKREGRRVLYWLNREQLATAMEALGEEVGIRVKLDRSWKQEAPKKSDLPYWGVMKKTPKTRRAASTKKATKKKVKKKAKKKVKRTAKKASKKKRR